MDRLGLAWARFALSAWIGAAVLFVVVGVREVTNPEFSHEIKDRLVLLRFPMFYLFEFTLLGSALVGLLLTRPSEEFPRRTSSVSRSLLFAALVIAAVDYQRLYLPLVRMLTPPGQPRTAEFRETHRQSARINGINLLLCLGAATLLHWPRSISRESSPPANS